MLLALLLVGLGAGGAWRARVARMPLEIGPTLVLDQVSGRPVLRLRARLGLGRCVLRTAVDAVLRSGSGPEIRMVVEDPPGRRVGPWTVTLRWPEQTEGTVRVTVTAEEPGQSWSVTREWRLEEAKPGRFLPPVERHRERWQLAAGRWCDVQRALPGDEG